MKKRYWLTPPELYADLDREFHFDFDPCPCPRPQGYDTLVLPWGKSNYVNPPFKRDDGIAGYGPTTFARKAIYEQQQFGRSSVLLVPVQSYVELLVGAGAEVRAMGRVKWLEADTKEPIQKPSTICAFILKGGEGKKNGS
jgi:hypothetical protein